MTDLDTRAARLRDAGVPFLFEPLDIGTMRVCFVYDPDGTLLEMVQGPLHYTEIIDAAQVADEAEMGAPPRPRFDHVALTVSDRNRAIAFYSERFGFTLIGTIDPPIDMNGFGIAYLRSGTTVLELFTFDHALIPRARQTHAAGFAFVDAHEDTERMTSERPVQTALSDEDRRLLRALFETVIPTDDAPGGWDGGVARLLDRHLGGFLAWASSPLLQAVSHLSAAGFDTVGAVADRERLVADLPADILGAVLRVAYEGYYAGTAEPAGWAVAGFQPVPAGVTTIDPEPISAISADRMRSHYDVVVVGAGAGGVVVAHELAAQGRDVLLVERGDNHRNSQLRGNHLQGKRTQLYDVTAGPGATDSRVLERSDGTVTVLAGDGSGEAYGLNAMTVGGGTRVWQGMAWRFYPEDFAMASTYGVPADSTLADWPFSYEDLAPYYDRVEQELGVSGDANSAMALRTPRAGRYPMPSLPDDSARLAFGHAAARLGWDTSAIPFAINSVPRNGRPACVRCSQCVGHACPVDAKNGTHNTFLPRALATGRCSLVTSARATNIVHDGRGRATGIRLVVRSDGRAEPVARDVGADLVVVAAGAIETPRLLLASGLGNDWVGRNHHSHGIAMALALRGPEVKSTHGPGHSVATVRFVHGPDKVWGGGVMFDLPMPYPLLKAQLGQMAAPRPFGAEHKAWMRQATLSCGAMAMVQEIPHAVTRVSVDPSRTDALGMPVARLRGEPHPASVEAAEYMAARCREWVAQLGGESIISSAIPGVPQGAEHSAGTARLGSDPGSSACDPTGRLWHTSNVYVADASLHPTNGGFNPALTVMANAMRVAEWVR